MSNACVVPNQSTHESSQETRKTTIWLTDFGAGGGTTKKKVS